LTYVFLPRVAGFPRFFTRWVNHISLVGIALATLSAKLAGSQLLLNQH
jgi:hypothetical protein